MPEYVAPAVFVGEEPAGAVSIEGVPTAMTAFIGQAVRGSARQLASAVRGRRGMPGRSARTAWLRTAAVLRQRWRQRMGRADRDDRRRSRGSRASGSSARHCADNRARGLNAHRRKLRCGTARAARRRAPPAPIRRHRRASVRGRHRSAAPESPIRLFLRRALLAGAVVRALQRRQDTGIRRRVRRLSRCPTGSAVYFVPPEACCCTPWARRSHRRHRVSSPISTRPEST